MATFSNLAELEARATLIRNTIASFCHHFVTGAAPDVLLSSDFTASSPTIYEHGPAWAARELPFLARTFTGRSSAGHSETSGPATTTDDYFAALGSTLQFFPDEHTIPPPEKFVIDPVNGVGAVKAKCKLASIKTGKSWTEEFVFWFAGFDGEGKIEKLEIWSDGLSAWNAVADGAVEKST